MEEHHEQQLTQHSLPSFFCVLLGICLWTVYTGHTYTVAVLAMHSPKTDFVLIVAYGLTTAKIVFDITALVA